MRLSEVRTSAVCTELCMYGFVLFTKTYTFVVAYSFKSLFTLTTNNNTVAKLLEPGDRMRGVCVRAIRIERPHCLSSANCQFINDVRHALW